MGDERQEQAMDRLAALASKGIPGEVDPAHDDAEHDRFVAAVARGALRHRGDRATKGAALPVQWRWASGLAVAVALAVAIAAFWPAKRLGYVIESGVAAGDVAPPMTRGEGDYISAPVEGDARLRFTDGSAVVLSPGSSLRIAEVTSNGARMVLEEGQASLRITRRPHARWAVEAGPYSVQVTGTEFDVAWWRTEGTLRVNLREGSVVVRGPTVTADGLALRAGQRLIARLHEGDVQIAAAEITSAAAPEPAIPPVAAVASASSIGPAASVELGAARPEDSAMTTEDLRVAGSEAASPKATATAPSWSRRVAAGAFQEVLAEAEQRGIEAVLEQGPLDDLVALGDAARYARRSELAQRALSTTRKRFPGTSQGKAAAFLLGRLLDSGGSPGAAIAWYDAYLGESPAGPYAAEALGRKMVAIERTAGRGAARTVARMYLERYPRGAHASFARALMER